MGVTQPIYSILIIFPFFFQDYEKNVNTFRKNHVYIWQVSRMNEYDSRCIAGTLGKSTINENASVFFSPDLITYAFIYGILDVIYKRIYKRGLGIS